MTGAEKAARPDNTEPHIGLRFGALVALAVSGLTVATFALAYMAGSDDSPYPYSSDAIAGNWPREYLWMFPAMLLMLLFVAFIASVHEYAPAERKIFSLLGLCLAIIAAAVLLINYFIQVTVMQPNLEKNQLDGWAMLTMYNPNGVFIALEELGFILMSLALAVVALVFLQKNKIERTIRWLFIGSAVASVGALIAVSLATGIDRGYLFEIIVISIVWSTLIIGGPLVAVVFRRAAAQSPLEDLPTEDRDQSSGLILEEPPSHLETLHHRRPGTDRRPVPRTRRHQARLGHARQPRPPLPDRSSCESQEPASIGTGQLRSCCGRCLWC